MAFWITLRDQLTALWKRWSIGQRFGFGAAALACFGAVVGTMIWASQPDYIVIASQLTPTQAAEMAGVLDTEKITWKLNFSSSAISVANRDVAAARLALKDQLSPVDVSETSRDSFLPFGSPREEEDRRRTALEKRVARSVTQIRGIRAATVSISRPDQSPFTVEQSPVTAAVVIEPAAGELITTTMAHTIISVVARSVPGLTNSNVVLTDTSGRQFGSREGIETELAMQLEYRRRLEADLAQSAETLLKAAQGVRAVVRVTADIDFSKLTRKVNTFDPDAKVKRTESIISSRQDSGVAPPVGTPGSATNLPNPTNANPAGGGKYTNEQIDTEYDNSFTNEEITVIPGKIRRLTVAAIVDVGDQSDGPTTGAPAATGRSLTLQQQQIENILKSAVGFDPLRSDEIQVTLAQLAPDISDSPLTPGFSWNEWLPLIQSVSLGLAATLAFLIGVMLVRRMKPIVITETVGPGIPLADARRLASISEQAKANPEVVASILTAWMNGHASPTGSDLQASRAPQNSASATAADRPSIPVELSAAASARGGDQGTRIRMPETSPDSRQESPSPLRSENIPETGRRAA